MAALELNAVLHCNLSCVGCSHGSPESPEGVMPPGDAYRDLRALADVVRVGEVRVVGGEPLLHPQLVEFLQAIQASGIRGRVRLITNGTRLHLTPWGWLQHVDEVSVSRYPNANIRPGALDELTDRCRRLRKRLVLNDYHSFRLMRPGRPLDKTETAAVFGTCQMAHTWVCHTVHDGFLYTCPQSAPLTLGSVVHPEDRCALSPAAGLRDRLAALLGREEPLDACRECLGSVGNLIPHHQANAQAWRALSHRGEIDHSRLAALYRNPWAHDAYSQPTVLVRGHPHWGAWRSRATRLTGV
jgi:GTP 3',8-cyclase